MKIDADDALLPPKQLARTCHLSGGPKEPPPSRGGEGGKNLFKSIIEVVKLETMQLRESL